ncbi:MAG: glycosyltransferase family 4 protein [Mucilaginibacter sp.]
MPFLNAAISVKNVHKELRLCLILPDLPQFMNRSRSVIGNFIIDQNKKKLEKTFNAVDYYVLLTEYMAQKLPVEGKRWTVMEGIFNQEDTTSFDKEDKRNKKTILYTGTLAKRYGILTLLNAFSLIKDKDCELVICGEGDAETEVIKASGSDKRILFKGTLDRPIVLQMQRNASLLINPRSPEGEFTKFSFPSKTMEYLASGTPTLLFKLPGIPKEYYDYCFTPDSYSAESLAQKIVEVLNLNSLELAEIGSKAREFILNNKGPKTQCKKIFDLIESN